MSCLMEMHSTTTWRGAVEADTCYDPESPSPHAPDAPEAPDAPDAPDEAIVAYVRAHLRRRFVTLASGAEASSTCAVPPRASSLGRAAASLRRSAP